MPSFGAVRFLPFRGVAIGMVVVRGLEPLRLLGYRGHLHFPTLVLVATSLTFNYSSVRAGLKSRRLGPGPSNRWALSQYGYGVVFLGFAALLLPSRTLMPARGFDPSSDSSILDLLSWQVFLGIALIGLFFGTFRGAVAGAAVLGELVLVMWLVHGQLNVDFLAQWTDWCLYYGIGGGLLGGLMAVMTALTYATPLSLAQLVPVAPANHRLDPAEPAVALGELVQGNSDLKSVPLLRVHDYQGFGGLAPNETQVVGGLLRILVNSGAGQDWPASLDVYVDDTFVRMVARGEFGNAPGRAVMLHAPLERLSRILTIAGGTVVATFTDDSLLYKAAVPRP